MNASIVKQIVLSRRKSLLYLAALIAIALSVHLLISLFLEPRLEPLRAEWGTMRAAESRGAAHVSKETIYNNGKNDLGKLRERIYHKNQFARFVGEIYAAADRNDLELTAITYKPDLNKDENLFKYSMNLSTDGRYLQQKRFLRDLNMVDNLLHIDAISLASQGRSADMVQLQTQITAYFRAEGQ